MSWVQRFTSRAVQLELQRYGNLSIALRSFRSMLGRLVKTVLGQSRPTFASDGAYRYRPFVDQRGERGMSSMDWVLGCA
jgi:hypothetical protein